jgi:hypothetical protein
MRWRTSSVIYSVESAATIATTMAVMAKTSLVFRLKAGIKSLLKANSGYGSYAIFGHRNRKCKGSFS